MDSFDKIRNGQCPNDCGPLSILKKPHPILFTIPEDLLDSLEGVDAPHDMFGCICGLCPECGFIVSSSPTWEYDYDLGEWRPILKRSTEDK